MKELTGDASGQYKGQKLSQYCEKTCGTCKSGTSNTPGAAPEQLKNSAYPYPSDLRKPFEGFKLESPIFIHLRLQLLEPTDPQHPYLLKSLYGILMLLPQSVAFKILRDRLESVSSLTVGMGAHSGERSGGKSSKKASEEYAALLSHFEMVQAAHAEARRQVLKGESLHGK